MAVLSKFPGLNVHIVVNGVARPEIDPPDDDVEDTRKRVTRYIEAESGANFEVRFSLDKAFKRAVNVSKYDLCVGVWIDGLWIKGSLCSKSKLKSLAGAKHITTIEGVEVGSGENWNLRKFVFSDLVANDNSIQSLDQKLKGRVSDLGQISVRFFRVHMLATIHDDTCNDPIEKHSFNSIPEKALKGRAISRKAGYNPLRLCLRITN
jgi:hypothetical protein